MVVETRVMPMDFDGHISESAFLVNESRARGVKLSKDRFAALWVGDSTRRLWDSFTAQVYPHDAIELGLRNRFFLERLSSFVESFPEPAFVNIGAGFTSYPFLIDKRIACMEVDYPHVIEFKRSKVERWTAEGLLPPRDVKFVPCDLNVGADRKRLALALEEVASRGPSFVLMEGLTYYLSMGLLEDLFEIFRGAQTPGSAMAFDFWRPENASHPVFLRFEKFFAESFGVEQNRYNFMDPGSIASIKDYRVAELRSVQELEKLFSDTRVLQDPAGILPESYALLLKGAR
jgi:O-methyltransferase involved in polyketide biosynthesis